MAKTAERYSPSILSKTKRIKPRYVNSRCDDPGKFRQRVVLPDGKNTEKDLTFVTRESFASKQVACQHSALLAIKHLTPSLPLERTLPQPYASVWKGLASANSKISASSKYVSKRDFKVVQIGRATEKNKKTANRYNSDIFHVRM
eukprot:UN24081